MKKQLFNFVAVVAIMFSMTFVSCNPNEVTKTGVDALIAEGVLYGELDHEVTLDATVTYKLTGTFIVDSAAVLNIPAGTRIEASEGFGSYIIVAQGGKINVNGTAASPVVMTSDDEAHANSGYWGGLIINGKAKISGPSGATTTSACEMNSRITSYNVCYTKLLRIRYRMQVSTPSDFVVVVILTNRFVIFRMFIVTFTCRE